MSSEPAAPGTKGVTAKVLATVDLGPEIEGLAGLQLRMRLVTIEPGGVFGPLHDHKGRPGTVYVLQGTITDHRDGIATDYGPGPGWPEDRNTTHWLENRGTVPAVEISVDIVKATAVPDEMSPREAAERIRHALLEAALRAHEDAGFRGLCAEGRWEAALDALRSASLGPPSAGSRGVGPAEGPA